MSDSVYQNHAYRVRHAQKILMAHIDEIERTLSDQQQAELRKIAIDELENDPNFKTMSLARQETPILLKMAENFRRTRRI